MTIGEAIKKKITESGKTIPQVATKARISPQTIYCWIWGTAEPSLYSLIRVADVLGITLDDIVGRKVKQ